MIKLSLLQSTPTILIVVVVFVLILVFYVLGNRIRSRSIKKDPNQTEIDLSSINGMLLGLLGLLLAFTFSMSNSRFDTRRQLVIEEANNIGTVILRTEMYPDSIRKLLRTNLKEYVDERIAFYEAGMDVKKVIFHYLKADSLSKVVWSVAADFATTDIIVTRNSEFIPALNAMIDITTTRRAAGEATIPDSIMYFLLLLCFCSAFLLGYDHKQKIDWIVVIGFAVMLSGTVFTIIDLDRPRSGLINMDTPNQKIVELRGMFVEK